jgi:hypothetical protein
LANLSHKNKKWNQSQAIAITDMIFLIIASVCSCDLRRVAELGYAILLNVAGKGVGWVSFL